MGGDNGTSVTCTDLGNSAGVWPDSWAVSTAGTYTASIDLSGAALSGTGLWSITLINGWATGGSSNYDATFTMTGLCTSEDVVVLVARMSMPVTTTQMPLRTTVHV